MEPEEVLLGMEPEEVGMEPEEVLLGMEPEEVGMEPEEVLLGMEPEEVGMEPEEVGMEPEEVGMEPEEVGMEPEEVLLGMEPEEVDMEPEEVCAMTDCCASRMVRGATATRRNAYPCRVCILARSLVANDGGYFGGETPRSRLHRSAVYDCTLARENL
jgi:hypothetical protein